MKHLECCICGKSIDWDEANNAEPVAYGECCDDCNTNIVIPARLAQLGIRKNRNSSDY